MTRECDDPIGRNTRKIETRCCVEIPKPQRASAVFDSSVGVWGSGVRRSRPFGEPLENSVRFGVGGAGVTHGNCTRQ